jgi:multiple antibiotic resistance protein
MLTLHHENYINTHSEEGCMFDWNWLVKEALFFLIMINPISKAVIVNMLPSNLKEKKIGKFLVKGSFVALILLVVFAFAGSFILNTLFRIDINALRIAGGFVLALTGFKALDKGIFFQMDQNKSLWDLAIVPFASPLIAGPATITAVIVSSSTNAKWMVTIAIILAILANFIIMYLSLKSKTFFKKVNLTGAIIRITGLLIMAMGVDMMITGMKVFFNLGI